MTVLRLQTYRFWALCMPQAPQGDLIDEQSLLAERRADGALEALLSESLSEPRVDDRRVLSDMIFVNRNGLRWCDAPRDVVLRRRCITFGSAGATMASSPGS